MNMFKPSKAKTIDEYIDSIAEPRKTEIIELDKLIRHTLPNCKPIFAVNMLGYGPLPYRFANGKMGEWPLIALASQKNYISLYVCSVKDGTYITEFYKKDLPKADIGKSCVRFKSLSDVDLEVIMKMLKQAEKVGGLVYSS